MFTVFKILLTLWLIQNVKQQELNLNFFQNDYQVIFERMELVTYSKDYYRTMSVMTRKYNRTQPVLNATFSWKKDVGNDLTFTVQAYKFMSNEYRHFPMRFAGNVCKAMGANIAGIKDLLKCGNLPTGRCPFVKDQTYRICNFYPDPAKLPPYMPDGQYKLQIELEHFSVQTGIFDVYGSVTAHSKISN